ncbi:11090_t:CDS:2 [Acaulospora colombiana]|uniref:11090_t:CDS:1 n=1 Tax=Acaulospora colombiana TaxID=27376 RepID=A0ACA9KHP4_9GLOM|nr:11090_t:CDS:2 [Acaulospora colombiana]
MEIDNHLSLTQSQKEDLIDTQLWMADTETIPAIISANHPSNDIHLTPPEDEQQKILDFCNEITLCDRSPEAIINFFLKFRNETRGYPRPNLPENLSYLRVEVQDIFPLTKRVDLRDLRILVDKLKEHYYVSNKLPELYFYLLPLKEPLPPSYKDLSKNLIGYLPVSNNVADFKEAVQILRNESYALKKLLADYIMTKRSSPPVHWYSENYEIFSQLTIR